MHQVTAVNLESSTVEEATAKRPLLGRGGPWLCVGTFHRYAIRQVEVEIHHLPVHLEGLRVVHLSDLHFRPRWHAVYDRVLAEIEAMSVDLILCSGDIVEDKKTHLPAMANVLRFIEGLKSRLGFFSILGNHDNPRLGTDLQRNGVSVISGQRELVGGELEIIGAPGHLRQHLNGDFAAGFASHARGCPRIVLAHFPDHFPMLGELQPDIYLCGHTHGGQVCLPGGWPIVRHDASRRAYCRGQHRFGRTHYVVNHGLGFSGLNLRIFCPPEIVVLHLRRSTALSHAP